jgi:hypothetical protein
MKTVIQVWTQECVNVQTGPDHLFWGFGDMIRSTIFLHQFCMVKGYQLILDHQLHPVSSFLTQIEHPFSALILENRHSIPHVPRGKVIPFIESSAEEVVFLFATEFCFESMSAATKDFIKSVLTPNFTLSRLVNSYREKLPSGYNIVHCRLGDSSIGKALDEVELRKYVKIIDKYADQNFLLVTDSERLKKQMELQGNLNVFDLKIGHLGYCKDREAVRDTLVEFFLITGATKIKTYTVYPWVSSFVYWISKVYDIPLASVFGRSLRLIFFRLFWNVQIKLHLLSVSVGFDAGRGVERK